MHPTLAKTVKTISELRIKTDEARGGLKEALDQEQKLSPAQFQNYLEIARQGQEVMLVSATLITKLVDGGRISAEDALTLRDEIRALRDSAELFAQQTKRLMETFGL